MYKNTFKIHIVIEMIINNTFCASTCSTVFLLTSSTYQSCHVITKNDLIVVHAYMVLLLIAMLMLLILILDIAIS